MISVIIPTRNRCIFLRDALETILKQSLSPSDFEIIVVDNYSTDKTHKVVEDLNKGSGRIRYLFAPEPGLHIGRHLGAIEAKGEILTFTDDDIFADPRWLEAIAECFQEPEIVLVGGKILPKWEGLAPEWINIFQKKSEYGWHNGYLSLLDFGDHPSEVPAKYIWGCNFSIRKSVLFECGGFHPDGMPGDLVRYRGDGETGLCRNIEQRGYKALYQPKALIYHRVPAERLTVEYFCSRAFNQGVSDSYSEIRINNGILKSNSNDAKRDTIFKLGLNWLTGILKQILSLKKRGISICLWPNVRRIEESYKRGKTYHRQQVSGDSKLLKHVLKDIYY